MTRQSLGLAFRGAGGFVASRPDWVLERLATMPSTNVRIFVTLVVFVATAMRYLTARDGWAPNVEWVGLLLGMAGIDVAQFYSKRRTYQNGNGNAAVPPQNIPENGDAVTTDPN